MFELNLDVPEPSQTRVQITEQEASVKYGMSVHWFRRKRWEGGGPEYRKIGNRCLYTTEELDRYFTDCTRKNTSEYQTRKPVEAIEKKRTAKEMLSDCQYAEKLALPRLQG